jgi:hypothetical protein
LIYSISKLSQMKTFKLVILISMTGLLIPLSIKTSAQQSTQNKPKESVVAYEVAGMNEVIAKKDFHTSKLQILL